MKKLFCTRALFKHLAISLFFIILSAAQYISLPLWHVSFIQEDDIKIQPGVPFLMLFLISFLLSLSRGISCLFTWYFTGKPKTAKFTHYWHFYVIIGLFLALNGILLVYTSSPLRTPPILQILLLNTGFVWVYPTTKMFSRKNEKTEFKFCSCTPIISILLTLYGIVMAFLPSIFYTASNQTPSYLQKTGSIWFFLFFLSMFPGAIANIFTERFFRKRNKPTLRNNSKNFMYDLMTMSFFSYSAQFLMICVLFWVDMIPFLGTSTSISEFTTGIHNAFSTMVKLQDHSWLFGFIFYLSFFLQTMTSVFISPISAKFVNMATTLSTPTAILFLKWSFKNSEDEKISPYWSLIPAIFLLLCGTITWKIWIYKEQNRILKRAPPVPEVSNSELDL